MTQAAKVFVISFVDIPVAVSEERAMAELISEAIRIGSRADEAEPDIMIREVPFLAKDTGLTWN